MAEHHEGVIHLVGGMSPETFQKLVDSGEINPLTGKGLDENGIVYRSESPGLGVQQSGMSVTGAVSLTGTGNPE